MRHEPEARRLTLRELFRKWSIDDGYGSPRAVLLRPSPAHQNRMSLKSLAAFDRHQSPMQMLFVIQVNLRESAPLNGGLSSASSNGMMPRKTRLSTSVALLQSAWAPEKLLYLGCSIR